MAVESPIFSLQTPKDISITDIESELSKIWQSYGMAGEDGALPAATRATTFTLVVYEPEETQHLLAALGFYTGPIDGIMGPQMLGAIRDAQKALGLKQTGQVTPELLGRLREALAKKGGNDGNGNGVSSNFGASPKIADAIALRNPCRIITLVPINGQDEGVKAQVSAYCPIQKQSSSTLICCEYITLTGTVAALERVGGMIPALLIGGLPKFLWWKAAPDPNNTIFKRLAAICSSVMVDSAGFNDVEPGLLNLQSLLEAGTPVVDLNWRRLGAWQELTAEAYDPPKRREALPEVDRVTIDYEKGNPAQPLLFLSWLASRLHWLPVSYQHEISDYDIHKITFLGENQRQIEAELAGLPVADVGDIPGDLIALRLSSTSGNTDCATVICSENGGCMRMETGGGAQSGLFQQVTTPDEQQAEILLSQQLSRSGREVLFEESIAVTAQILQLDD